MSIVKHRATVCDSVKFSFFQLLIDLNLFALVTRHWFHELYGSLPNLSIIRLSNFTLKLHKFDDIDQHKHRHSSILLSSSLECTFIWKSFPRFPFAGKENYYLEFHCRSIISNGTRILHICYRNSKGQQPCKWGKL